MIFCQMMNNSNKATLSYTISDTLVSVIMTFIAFSVFIPCFLSRELDWWQLLPIGAGCLWSVIETLHCFIIDITVSFDNDGFIVNAHNRFTSNNRMRLYKWNDIHTLSFLSIYSRNGKPRLHVTYKDGGNDQIVFRYTVKNKKFTKLAKYYSGREDIVESNRKRKLYEKDW